MIAIEPAVTTGQAKMIAEWADTMAGNPPEKRPADPEATAIEQFKRLYSVVDGKWTRKETPKPVTQQEAFKTIDGKKRPASDFLVVGDKTKPDTWHLPVKVNGRIDHGLMEAAFAAVQNDDQALAKLKTLYGREEMPLPTEEKAMERFTEMTTPGSVDDYLNRIRIAFNKQFSPPGSIDMPRQYYLYETFKDHPKFGTAVVAEYAEIYYLVPFVESDSGFTFDPMSTWKEVRKTWEVVATPTEAQEMDFAESASGMAISLAEANSPDVAPLSMDVCLIQPGWGNKKDNNYYSAEMLKRDAHRFVGAKMFEKDHTDDKTTRDWVSMVDSIVGETAEGGPIARVVIHDPNFAARARALNKAGKLKELPCSIMARGTAREAEIDGKTGNKVEAITEVGAVDWVTAAGAGGHAVALQEAQSMTEVEQNIQEDEEVEVAEGSTEIIIAEDDAEPEAEDVETEVVDDEPEPEAEPEEEPLTGEEVGQALEAAKLPAAARARLEQGTYTEAALQEAIKAEKAYISELTEAGKPFAHAKPAPKQKVDLAEVEKRQQAANARFLGVRGEK